MRAPDLSVGHEYAYVVPGRRGEKRQVLPVRVLTRPLAGRVWVCILACTLPPIRNFPPVGAEVEVATRSLLSTWTDWEADTQMRDAAAGTPAVADHLPVLRPEDAVVQRLDEDKLLVLGNTDLIAPLGKPLYTLTPELTAAAGAELGNAFGMTNAALQAASSVQGLRQAGVVFQVSKTSLAQFRQLDAVMSNGEMLGVLRGKRIETLVRWNHAGTGLRSLASASGLIFAVAVIAGQAHMQRTLTAIWAAVDDLKGLGRDEQIAQVRVARDRVIKVAELAAELGALPPALAAELPDRGQLEVQLARAAREVGRHNDRLRNLPAKAGDKLQVLQATVPDVMFALALYAEAEATLMVAELLHRHEVAGTDAVTAAALERHELRQREERVVAGIRLADGVSKALKAVEAEPGGGWFAGGKRRKVRELAGQVRADLAALHGPTPPRNGAPAVVAKKRRQVG